MKAKRTIEAAGRGVALPEEMIFAAASVAVTDGAKEGDVPRFEIVAYTGGEMTLRGWSSPAVVELAGMELPEVIPVLADHDPRSPIGHGPAKVTGRKLVVTGEVLSLIHI